MKKRKMGEEGMVTSYGAGMGRGSCGSVVEVGRACGPISARRGHEATAWMDA